MHPIALRTEWFTIHWYGVLMALGFVAGVGVLVLLARRAGREPGYASDLGCWIMLSGVIGARIAHVLANLGEYSREPLSALYVQRGGLIYYGGFVGAAVGIALFARRRGEKLLGVYDLVVVPLPLGHAFGRVGCLLNGCCHGTPTASALGVQYPLDSHPGWGQFLADRLPHGLVTDLMRQLRHSELTAGQFQARLADAVARGEIAAADARARPVHPVQVYEAGLNIVLFAALLLYLRRSPRAGSVTAAYIMGYPAVRFLTEFYRGDRRLAWAGLSTAQWFSLGLFALGVVSWTILNRRERAPSVSRP